MPETDRDTHFQRSARLLAHAIEIALDSESVDFTGRVEDDEFYPLVLPLIARYAYDLVEHVLSETGLDTHPYHPRNAWKPEDIADLTEWPPE